MMRGRLSNVVAAALAVCALLAAHESSAAQTQAQTGAPQAPRQASGGATAAEPDLAIDARVTARELLFRKVPTPRVEFTGRPRRETVWESERQNLPEEVQPGVTYRDIGITLRIRSVFADIERIVAEALGEIPPSDDAAPPPATPERPSTPPAQTPDTTPTGAARPNSSLDDSPAQTNAPAARPRRPARRGRVR